MKIEELQKEVIKLSKEMPKNERILLFIEKDNSFSAIGTMSHQGFLTFVQNVLKENPTGIPFYQKMITKLKKELNN